VSEIGDFSTNIWDTEFGDETGVAHKAAEVSSISGWIQGNFGLLNNYIYTAFSGSAAGDVFPAGSFKLEEQNIYKQIYLNHYYKKAGRNVLRGIDGTLNADVDWVRLKEGDTIIQRPKRTETAKIYLDLAKEAAEELKNLVYYYNSYQASPRQVAGDDGSPYPESGVAIVYR